MRVAVGSLNPVKEAATAQALDTADIVTVDVDSGVAEQPRGRAETIEGAENRAAAALAATDCTYGVGIEGGVAEVSGTDGLFLIMWAAVTDGEQWGRGGGPTLRLPADIAERVRAGEELGRAVFGRAVTLPVPAGKRVVGLPTSVPLPESVRPADPVPFPFAVPLPSPSCSSAATASDAV